MKKLSVILASFVMMFAVCTNANAAGGLIVKAGVNYSNFDYKEDLKDIKNFDYKNFAGYHAGLGFQTGSLLGFSLQPELMYQVNSAQLDEYNNLKLNTVQGVVNLQWGLDLVIVKPFVFAAPYFAYNLSQAITGENAETKSQTTYKDVLAKAKEAKFDYGIGIGVGVEVFSFVQISAKYNWGFGQFESWKAVADSYKNKENYDTAKAMFSVSLALKF